MQDWRPGIAWQMGIAFVGVAVLAAVANFAVQRTISVTTTRVAPTQVETRPRPTVRRTEVVAAPAPVPLQDGRASIPALERLSDAVLAARQVAVDERHERMRTAGSEVRTALVRLHGNDGRTSQVLRTGGLLIDAETARDATHGEYVALLDRVDMRLVGAMEKAWKILGRVVARQSLVEADQRFEEVRRRAVALRDDAHTSEEVALLVAAEQQFAAVLAEGERTLNRTQGNDWVAQMRGDMARLATLREQLVLLDAQRAALLPGFRADVTALRSQLRRAVALPGPPMSAAQAPVHTAAPVAPRPTYPRLGASSVGTLWPGPRWEGAVVSTSQQAIHEGIAPSGLAWLSAGVLLLLLAVSTFTVLSILRPVQRLIAATRRIALGETSVRVPPGGSRELDGLARAFNRMAEQLEAAQSMARNYQNRLEARVAERTRQLQHQADHDALTQLPNRRQLFDQLRQVLTRTGGASRAGLFFIDLDNFKNINDGRGHGFGDRVLVAIAERLQQTVGANGFAARFGGDEFTVVAEARPDAQSLAQVGASLVRAFQHPLRLDGQEILVSVSVGAAFHPEHGSDAEELLRAADAALFHAKALGRNQMAVFTPELLEAASERFTTEQGLRRAVERGEFELVFQPEMDIARGEVAVCEALLRWRRPDGVLAGPDQFLAVAEDSGLIVEINDWVLRSALAAAARWREAGYRDVRVAVNASSRQLAEPGFVARVGTLLAENGLPAAALEIELTETVLQTGAATITGLRRLQEMGVTVALDDFGTGYSSLASLEQLPLSRVKLDRSLIAGIDESPRAASIANAIMSLCADIGVEVTAEGVERAAQLALLRNRGVTVQGYLLSRPLAESQLYASMTQLPQLLQSLLLSAPAFPKAGTSVVGLDLGKRRALRRQSGEG